MTTRLGVLAPLLLWSAACSDSSALRDTEILTDSSESGYTGPFAIESASHTCTPGDPDRWQYTVRTQGWAGSVALEIFETASESWPSEPATVWSEHHDLSNTDYDADGAWDEYLLQLHAVGDIAMQTAGATTAWDCSHDNAVDGVGGSLAWMAVMYNPAQEPQPLDCVVWGYQSSTYFVDQRGLACRCIDSDGDCSN